ncbi:hypothetical protein [Bacillus toyonensis]|uniref:hypothetical protein n=1 Tax=Bacillus toyonensis TaxID=155322 RepID=UPI002E204636|nr:hypothetical protein [Bacillus toyonensis]
MLDEINYIISEMYDSLNSRFVVENGDINREKLSFKLLNQFNEAKKFSEIDETWTEYSTIKDHITTFILSSSIKVNLKEEENLNVLEAKWLMSNEVALQYECNKVVLSCYRYGTFIKSQLDFDYKIEINVDENEDLIYKKLFFCLPTDLNKWALYEEVFGDSRHKFRTVILDIFNDYFKNKTDELKIIIQNTINKLTELLYNKMSNSSGEIKNYI